MKPRLQIIALAASALIQAAALGDLISGVAFENFSADSNLNIANDDSGYKNQHYWCVNASSQEDMDLVLTQYSSADTFISRPKSWVDSGATTNMYLAIDTHGAQLCRTISPHEQDYLSKINLLESSCEIGDGVYFDAMMLFTVDEDANFAELPATWQDGDKIAIWLAASDSGTTNLVITAGYYDPSTSASRVNITATNYIVTAGSEYGQADIAEGSWHRITVKARMSTYSDGLPIAKFKVFLDGSDIPLEAVMYGSSDDAAGEFLSAADPQHAVSSDYDLLGVASFVGAGAIDDIAWCDAAPLDESALRFKDESGKKYKTFQAALEGASSASLTLLEDYDCSEESENCLLVESGKDVLLDLKGNTLSTNEESSAVSIMSHGTLTITNSSRVASIAGNIKGSGTVTSTKSAVKYLGSQNPNTHYVFGGYFIEQPANATIPSNYAWTDGTYFSGSRDNNTYYYLKAVITSLTVILAEDSAEYSDTLELPSFSVYYGDDELTSSDYNYSWSHGSNLGVTDVSTVGEYGLRAWVTNKISQAYRLYGTNTFYVTASSSGLLGSASTLSAAKTITKVCSAGVAQALSEEAQEEYLSKLTVSTTPNSSGGYDATLTLTDEAKEEIAEESAAAVQKVLSSILSSDGAVEVEVAPGFYAALYSGDAPGELATDGSGDTPSTGTKTFNLSNSSSNAKFFRVDISIAPIEASGDSE